MSELMRLDPSGKYLIVPEQTLCELVESAYMKAHGGARVGLAWLMKNPVDEQYYFYLGAGTALDAGMTVAREPAPKLEIPDSFKQAMNELEEGKGLGWFY